MTGQILGGRYRILKFLGQGGFAETYIAEDIHLPDRPQHVVKKLQPLGANGAPPDPAVLQIARRLFDREAKVLYQLGNHDRIPKLLAHFQESQEFYLVQEFIEGQDLSSEICPGKVLTEEAVIDLLRSSLEVLVFVHQHDTIHRDIKPSNLIRRASDGRIVPIDFGAAKQISSKIAIALGQAAPTVIGTPGYMPKEQELGKPELSSDIYALGMTAIQALTGVLPGQLPTDADGEIIWQNRARVSNKIAAILSKMVRYDYRQRYPSAIEVLEALDALDPRVASVTKKSTKPKKSNRLTLWLSLLALLFATAALGITITAIVSGSGFIAPKQPREQNRDWEW
ncbi:MAG: serine/threonine protein kinase [Oscillatoria sp. SIO1A7]|nr:serine/threonine protein kinase [Oscillatoria sp. SIO1A7]